MIEYIDWSRLGLPFSIKIGVDGFPGPGKTVRWYREQKKADDATWTQKRLAQELGLTERAIYYLESQDSGLDSLFLRRKLALLFDIPPLFLGLSALTPEIDPGQTIRLYRKMKPKGHPLRSQAGLARAIGMTEKAIRDMEKRNIGLDSITRRRVLAMLLDIPQTASGIITLNEILLQQVSPARPLIPMQKEKASTLDLAVYRERLKAFWKRNHTDTVQDRLANIAADMAQITAVLPYARRNDEKEVLCILCLYHHLYAHILRDQGCYDIALIELEKAVTVAHRSEHPHLLAVTLLRLGSVFRDRGTVYEAQAKIEAARGNSAGANQKKQQANTDYRVAMNYYTQIRQIERLPRALFGVVSFDEGYAQAHLAGGDLETRRTALACLATGGKIIAETRDSLEEEFAIRITERTYYNTQAATLLAAQWPHEALRVLADVMDLPEEGDMMRQNAYTDYLWAQAYADLGLVDASVVPAQDAFVRMKQIKSHLHMARIAGLQGELSQYDSKNIEVIRLKVMIHT